MTVAAYLSAIRTAVRFAEVASDGLAAPLLISVGPGEEASVVIAASPEVAAHLRGARLRGVCLTIDTNEEGA